MEKSRVSKRLKQAGFFTVVIILGNILLNGCGQHSTVTGILGAGGILGQQSFVEQGGGDQIEQRPYLALTGDDEVSTIRESVAENAANKALASQVISASVNRAGTGAEVQIRTTTSNSPLIFKGDLKATEYLTYVGNFPEATGQRPDLTLYVSCSDQSCNHADLFLSDNQGSKAAIVVSSEDRILHTTIPDGETPDQVKGLFNLAQNTKVHYNLTETLPGISTYTVSTIEKDPKNSKVLFEGPIQNTADGLVPAQSALLDKTETASLAGVDADNLILQVASTPDPKKPEESKTIIVEVQAKEGTTIRPKPLAHKNPTTSVNVPEKCKVQLTGEVNPMVNDILKECNQTLVTKRMKSWWFNENKGGFKNFMNLYEASKTAEGKSRAHDFKTMVNILHTNNFPTVWSWVTQVESTFNWSVPIHSKAKELGVWQISEGTRNVLGLSAEGAQEIQPSTEKALQYYKDLMQSKNMPPHNVPMLLAGYNMGQGGVDKGMKILANAGLGTNFWELCKKSLNGGTCKYVSEIVSGMILSLDPKDYGMTNIGAMEAK